MLLFYFIQSKNVLDFFFFFIPLVLLRFVRIAIVIVDVVVDESEPFASVYVIEHVDYRKIFFLCFL